jgi:hypothetical protein
LGDGRELIAQVAEDRARHRVREPAEGPGIIREESMSDLLRRASAVVLMAMLILIVGPGRAKAELGGIVVTDTTLMPTGDPQTIFDFQIALAPDTSLSPGDSFEVFNIPDVNTEFSPNYVYMDGKINYASDFNIVVSTNTDGTTNVTLNYIGELHPLLRSHKDGLPIGDLFVVTTAEYPTSLDSPLFDPIPFASSVGGKTFSGMSTPAVVPEPASLALALVGAGLAAPWLLRNRRRAARG